MNYRRSKLLPVALVGLCILVSAVAYAPGRTGGAKHMVADRIRPIEPAAVILDPSAPLIRIAANESIADVAITGDAGEILALGTGFDTAAMASLVAQHAEDEVFFDDMQQIASNLSAVGSDSASPIRLAALDGHSIGSLGGGSGGGAARSREMQPLPGDSAPAETATVGASDSSTHSGQTGEGSTPVESLSSAPPDVPVDAPDSSGTGTAKPDAVPSPTDPAEFTPVDPWPTDQLPIDTSGAQPVSVPEPGTLGLLALGLAGMAGARRRRAQRSR